MQASCLQENLNKGLSVVGRAAASRPTLPVLSHVLVAAEQSQIKLAATDLEVSLICRIGAKVEKEGAITLPVRLFTDLVGSLEHERINMGRNNGSLALTCQRNDASVKGIDAEEFPILPSIEDEREMSLDPDVLRTMISRAVVAAATDESRPILTGVLVRFEGDALTLTAADGFRMSVVTAKLPDPASEPLTILVPAKAMRELLRVAKDEEQPIRMCVPSKGAQVLFHLEGNAGTYEGVFGIDLVSQLLQGNFVDYRQIMPKSHNTQVVLNTEAFLKACKTANILVRDDAHTIRLDIHPEEGESGQVKINAHGSETGMGVIDLDATVEGGPIAVKFNVTFLIEALSVMGSEQVVVELSSPTAPVAFRPEGVEGFTHIIMPMTESRK